MKLSLLIALFVAVGSIVAKAETIDQRSPFGDQDRIFVSHQEPAAVSAPTAVAAVRAAGLEPATLPVRIGSTYVMRAVNKRGTRLRVVLAADTGRILAIHSTAATKQDDGNKPLENSRAKPKPASSSTAAEPKSSISHRPSLALGSSMPMQILPKVATLRHKAGDAEPPTSHGALVRLAWNDPAEAQVPTALLGTLRSVGLTLATAPVKVEPTYVVQAVNQRGMTLRVLLGASSGDILAIQPTPRVPRRERHDGDTLGAPGFGAPNASSMEALRIDADPLPSTETAFVGP